MKSRFFYSTANAAKVLGVSIRTIARVAENHGIDPLEFEGCAHKRHFWTCHHLAAMRRFLRKPLAA